MGLRSTSFAAQRVIPSIMSSGPGLAADFDAPGRLAAFDCSASSGCLAVSGWDVDSVAAGFDRTACTIELPAFSSAESEVPICQKERFAETKKTVVGERG